MPEFEPPRQRRKPRKTLGEKLDELIKERKDLEKKIKKLEEEVKLAKRVTHVRHAAAVHNLSIARLELAKVNRTTLRVSKRIETLYKKRKRRREEKLKGIRGMKEKLEKEEAEKTMDRKLKNLKRETFLEDFEEDLSYLRSLKDHTKKLTISDKERQSRVYRLTNDLSRRIREASKLGLFGLSENENEKQDLKDRLLIVDLSLKNIDGIVKSEFDAGIKKVIKNIARANSLRQTDLEGFRLSKMILDKWLLRVKEAKTVKWITDEEQEKYKKQLRDSFNKK